MWSIHPKRMATTAEVAPLHSNCSIGWNIHPRGPVKFSIDFDGKGTIFDRFNTLYKIYYKTIPQIHRGLSATDEGDEGIIIWQRKNLKISDWKFDVNSIISPSGDILYSDVIFFLHLQVLILFHEIKAYHFFLYNSINGWKSIWKVTKFKNKIENEKYIQWWLEITTV